MFVVKDKFDLLYGPFDTLEEANKWGKDNCSMFSYGYWSIVTLKSKDITRNYDV